MICSYYLEILALHSANPTNAVFQNSQQDRRQVLVKQLTLSKLDNLVIQNRTFLTWDCQRPKLGKTWVSSEVYTRM